MVSMDLRGEGGIVPRGIRLLHSWGDVHRLVGIVCMQRQRQHIKFVDEKLPPNGRASCESGRPDNQLDRGI